MTNPTYNKALWLAAATAVAATAAPASAEVYLTESQTLGVIFGDKAIVRREQKILDETLRKKIESESNLRFSENAYTFFIATQDGKPAKYAIVMNEIGKTEPITFMVGMSPEGKVTEVVIMEFRENRGWEVKEKRFLNQFRGKSVRNAIRVDEDILNYTGATLSSKAVARGVKKALVLLDAFYPGESRTRLSEARDFAKPLALAPISRISNVPIDLQLFRQTRYAMGTLCETRVWCDTAEEARTLFSEGFRELERLEQIFSAYREVSELNYVNRNAAETPVRTSEDFFSVTQETLRLSTKTDGVVDITLAPLLRAWGIREGAARVPSRKEIMEAKLLTGIEKVILDPRQRSIRFAQPGMELDFGGIAKGYAAGKVAVRLEELGAVSALVNLGRSSLCASRTSSRFADSGGTNNVLDRVSSWPVMIAHPDGKSSLPSGLYLEAGHSLSTSGTGERVFIKDGIEFSHILNAKTGMPLSGTLSSTVVAQNGVECEIASKELLLLDATERANWQQKRSLDGWARFEVGLHGELLEDSSL